MKKISKNLLSLFFLLATTVMFSQGKIKGTVVDSELNSSLPGVNVVVKGTNSGTTTDFDGKFTLNATASGQVVLSYVGYQNTTVNFTVKNGETVDLGTIKLNADAGQLEEVVVKSSVIDVAKTRKTPVAVSTIKAAEIQAKGGNQEVPELLANTPSVYTSKSGGGFGDSRINIRGFSQENIAVLVNGVPVNDMENSRVFWSNWAGLGDVTSALQVQRGLGSSKLAISSVGGTINFITRTSDMKEGGRLSSTIGNDNYIKNQVSYNTGKMKSGLSASVLLGQTYGLGYVDGTKGVAGNYFIALGYEFSEKSDVQFTFTGAPQWHHNRFGNVSIADAIKYGNGVDEPNRKYNPDWGYLDGQEYNMRRNYYHKPIASINWDYKFNDKTKLSTVFYGSWGRGGGSNGTGGIKGKNYSTLTRTADGLVDFDLIQAWNSGQTTSQGTRTQVGGTFQNTFSSGSATDLSTGISRINSVNSHDWYGAVINLNKKLTTELTLDFGIDARTYTGYHYTTISDLIGGSNFLDNSDKNNPNRILTNTYESSPSLNPFANVKDQEKISYNNDGNVRWYGAFTQLEYSKNNLSAFVQGSVSQQGFQRVDHFLYLASDPLSETDYENIIGYNAKGGVNYNLNENMNVFVNGGVYSKQPNFNTVYPNNKSVLNTNLTNEKVSAFEAGYGYRSSKFTANLNAYYTTWNDRYFRLSDGNALNPGGYLDFTGVGEVHTGVELELNVKPIDKLLINGMLSVGNWEYKGESVSNIFDASGNPFAGSTPKTLYLDGVKVGDAAQMTASLGATYEVVKNFKVDANYRMIDKLYAAISPSAAFTTTTNKGTLELPSYGLLDAGFTFNMPFGKGSTDSLNFRLNVNNVLDEVYIAESRTNIFADDNIISSNPSLGTYASNNKLYNGIATANNVYFGFGRTWNLGISYNF
jgi:outer membrane receptor protein involved in Fe transport